MIDKSRFIIVTCRHMYCVDTLGIINTCRELVFLHTDPYWVVIVNYVNYCSCVSETKFLGIIIDEKLTWDPQVQYLNKKKLSCAIGILNRIKDSMPATLYKNLYHTLLKSHLCYGITTWGGVSDAKLKPLFKVQKKCIRILFGDK